MERSGDRCEWPECGERGAELAHLRSVGMGGKHRAADHPLNVMWACADHARITDGEFGSGGMRQYWSAHEVLGLGDCHSLAFERRMVLRAHLESCYPHLAE